MQKLLILILLCAPLFAHAGVTAGEVTATAFVTYSGNIGDDSIVFKGPCSDLMNDPIAVMNRENLYSFLGKKGYKNFSVRPTETKIANTSSGYYSFPEVICTWTASK